MTFEGRHTLVLVTVALPVTLVACTIGETRYETVHVPALLTSKTLTCDSPIVTPDLSTLKACGDGKGHCYDKAKVPMPDTELDACDGDPGKLCVPDLLLKTGPGKLQSCTFWLGNKPGACMSTLVKDVKANLAQLKQDVCTDPDTRCVPCISPLDGSDTHACDEGVGVHQADCVGGSAASNAKTCCHGMGLCTDKSSIPPDSQDHMDRETCPADKVCAPAAMVQNKPVKCDVLGMGGVCLDLCFASMFQATTQVTRSSCGPTEVCMPCLLGKSQGMPGCD
jgi:hypothetical protein